jgi:hypothetical protein
VGTPHGRLGRSRGEARDFAEAVAQELRLGLEAEAQFASDQAFVLQRVLDGTLTGEELGAAVAAAGFDIGMPHGIALVVSPLGRSGDVDAAAAEARDAVPHLLDLGPGDALPPHHRLVVPQRTPAQWIEARAILHKVGERHHVLWSRPWRPRRSRCCAPRTSRPSTSWAGCSPRAATAPGSSTPPA